MKWIKNDVAKYLTAEEYIDTAFIPLVPFTLDMEKERLPSLAFQKEVTELICNQMEKEFQGRMMLFPSYMYGQSFDKQEELIRINAFAELIKTKPFQHLFFITFDSTWKKHETALNGHLIWLPVMKEGDLQSEETTKIIMDQVHQVKELVKMYWSN